MIYDPLDFFILIEVLKGETTTWEIGEKFYWEDKPIFKNNKDRDFFLTNKCSLICKRLIKMQEEGLVKITRNGGKKNVYEVDAKKVLFGLDAEIKFPLFGKKVFNKILKRVIFLKGLDKKWSLFEL